jgi:hypothetical protein
LPLRTGVAAKMLGYASDSDSQKMRAEGEIGDQQGATGSQDTSHFWHGRLNIRDVDERKVADDKVERLFAKWQPLSYRLHISPAGITSLCHCDQRGSGINAHHIDTTRLEHPAEAPLAAADVEGVLGRTCDSEGKHHRIEDVASAEVARFAHVYDPGVRRALPAVVYGEDGTSTVSHPTGRQPVQSSR